MKPIVNVFIFEMRLLFRRTHILIFDFAMPALMLFVMNYMALDFPNYNQFLLPGLIGWVALSASVQSVAAPLGMYKLYGTWKRIKSSPIQTWQFNMGFIFSRFVLALCSSVFLLLIGYWGYNIHVKGNIFYLFIILSLGIMSFMSLGILISSLLKNIESMSALASLIVYPMVFLSNCFYSIDGFPKPIVHFSNALPLTQTNFFLRTIIDGGELTTSRLTSGMAVILVWFLVCFVLATFKFNAAEG